MAAANASKQIQAAPASGAQAVTQAQEVQALADADFAVPVPAATFVAASGETVSADEVLRYVGNRAFVLRRIRDAIHSVHADLVFLQEVLGQGPGYEAATPIIEAGDTSAGCGLKSPGGGVDASGVSDS